ncbi:MAG: hypothetical protein O2794_01150 [bacterium]|nr:hypothetical protein [bacterium]
MKAVHKELVILSSLLLFSLIFWLSLATFLPTASRDSLTLLWSAVISAFVMMVLWSLIVILVESTIPFLIVWALSAYVGVIWFTTPVFIVGATLLFLAGVVGFYRTKSQVQKTLGSGLVRPIRRALPLMVTFFVITIAIAGYVKVPRNALVIKKLVPEYTFTKLLGYMQPTIRAFDGAFKADRTLTEYLKIKTERAIDADITDEQLAILVAESKARTGKLFSITIDENATLSHTMYQAGTAFLQKKFDIYEQIIPITIAVSLFFTLRIAGLILSWLAIIIAIMALRLLHRFAIVELRAIPATITAYSFP